MMRCSIDDCSRPSYSRGWCQPHYRRWARYGDPLGVPERPEPEVCAVLTCSKVVDSLGFCEGHYHRFKVHGDPQAWLPLRVRGASESDRFWSRVLHLSDCWLWTGARRNGYGVFKGRSAHRFSYAEQYGPIPDDLHVDHLCHETLCVRPSHLEAVTPEENTRRRLSATNQYTNGARSHCKHGHPWAGENVGQRPDGTRFCRECRRLSNSRRQTTGAVR